MSFDNRSFIKEDLCFKNTKLNLNFLNAKIN
jgi:hypothetical protein